MTVAGKVAAVKSAEQPLTLCKGGGLGSLGGGESVHRWAEDWRTWRVSVTPSLRSRVVTVRWNS